MKIRNEIFQKNFETKNFKKNYLFRYYDDDLKIQKIVLQFSSKKLNSSKFLNNSFPGPGNPVKNLYFERRIDDN